MKKYKLHIYFFCFMLMISSLWSQSGYSNEIFSVLQSGAGKVMGEGPVSVNGNLFAVLYNPSLLDENREKEIGVIHTRQFMNDITYNFIGFGMNYSDYRVVLAFARIGIDNIPDSRAAYVESGTDWGIDFSKVTRFNVADYFVLAGLKFPGEYYGWKAGITLKFLSRRYYVANGWGGAVDMGVHRRLMNNLIFGIRVSNFLGSSLHWSTGKNEWFAPGLSYGFRYQHILWQNITGTLVMNAFHYFDNRGESAQLAIGPASLDVSFGGEISYRHLIQFRLGRDQNGQFALGTTLFIPKIDIDYAFQRHTDLGDVHNISIIFRLPY